MPFGLLLRLQRVGLIALTYLGIVYALLNSAAFTAVAGKTAAAHRAFGIQIDVLARQLAWLLPLPLRPDTAAGFLQWRGYGFFAIVFAGWGLLAAAGAARRDEDRGLVEMWLASGTSRIGLLVSRIGAFTAVSACVVSITGFAAWLGCLVAGSPVSVALVAAESLALWALTLACYGITLLTAQLVADFRAAAAAGGVLLLVLFLLDGLGRSSTARPRFTEISIFFLYNQSNAIAPGGTFDVGATLALLAVAVVTLVGAVGAFVRRDLGTGLIRRRLARRAIVRTPSANPLLGLPALRGMWVRRVGAGAWVIGAAAIAAFIVSLAGVTYSFIANTPVMAGFLHGLIGDPHLVLLGVIWFSIAQGVLAILAVAYVARWANEDSSGVLEMELAEPRARWGVLLERGVELVLTLAITAFAASAVILLVAPSQSIAIPVGALMVATVLLIPFGLTFAAVGAVLAGWRPRVAVGVLSTVAVVSYLIFDLAPVFKWPGWVADLSVFQLYGTPLDSPVFVGGLVAMLGVVLIGFLCAGFLLQRRDVAR